MEPRAPPASHTELRAGNTALNGTDKVPASSEVLSQWGAQSAPYIQTNSVPRARW